MVDGLKQAWLSGARKVTRGVKKLLTPRETGEEVGAFVEALKNETPAVSLD